MVEKILITGGAGFIGSALSLALVQRGYTVRVLDNLSKQIHSDKPENSVLYRKIINQVDFVHGDVTDHSIWSEVIKDVGVIVHLAAETGTGQSMYEIIRYNDVNVGGTSILMHLIANSEHRVRKVILASSRVVYGEGKYQCSKHGVMFPNSRKEADMSSGIYDLLCDDCGQILKSVPTTEDSKIMPKSVYGATKYSQEMIVSIVCEALTIPYIIFRFQNVYGPGQSLTNPYAGILSIFSTRMRNNKSINLFEDGNESRDFVYIDDVVNVIMHGIEADGANNDVINIGSGGSTSVKQAAEILLRLLHSDSKIEITGNYRVGDIRHNVADITKMQTYFGYNTMIKFEEGVKRFVEWVVNQEITQDEYEMSLEEMKRKGLLK